MDVVVLLLVGLVAGTLGGMFGVGGATIMIPAIIIIFKTTQHMAQGTALAAMLLPVGIMAVFKYWQSGNVNIPFALLIAVGFLIGGYFGAVIAQPLADPLLRKLFGALLLVIAVQMMFF
jgi:hypothetical protein